ncbi:DUF2059 domain-containing protein [Luteimonas panaciterrae]|uniref:DUF2059 domain-containing protein n=1 Tax=Luteimonas panaciterrae TaxID=363885 RepID=UPI001CFBAC89|nr:DUF2059 domain-containing protein [Luteimonas panaciterrae]
MSLRTLLLAALLGPALIGLAAPAIAAPPSDAKLDELLEASRARQTLETLLPQIENSQKQMVNQMLEGQQVSEEQRKSFDRILGKSFDRMKQVMTWDKLAPLYRDAYRQSFEAEDVDAIIAFYRTPAGQKMLEKLPQLMQNTMAGVQKLLMPAMQELQRDLAEEAKQLENASSTAEPAHEH